jgi:hypothetical protein
MRRENMQFVAEKEQDKPVSLRVQVHTWLCNQKDGATFGDIYPFFTGVSPRSVRGVVADLKNSGHVTTKTCRCHKASVYYGVKHAI